MLCHIYIRRKKYKEKIQKYTKTHIGTKRQNDISKDKYMLNYNLLNCTQVYMCVLFDMLYVISVHHTHPGVLMFHHCSSPRMSHVYAECNQ